MVWHVRWVQHPCILEVRVDGEKGLPQVLRTLQELKDPGQLNTVVLFVIRALVSVLAVITLKSKIKGFSCFEKKSRPKKFNLKKPRLNIIQ